MVTLLSVASVTAALLAGSAAALGVADPRSAVRRATRAAGTPPDPAAGRRSRMGRPGAPPLRRRLLVCGLAAVAVWLALRSVGGLPDAVGWIAASLILVGGVVSLGWFEPTSARRRRTQLILDAPQALELLSACLAAGMPLRRATAAVVASFDGPLAEDLGAVQVLINLGVSDVEAWHTLRNHPQLGPAAVDLARSVESGTMMVQALAHHARDARTRRRASLEVAAKAVGVRSVLPLMICFLPSFMLLGIVPTVASAILNALF